MIALERGLTARADRYLLARDVSAQYAEQLRRRLKAFCVYCGCDILADAVTAELGNAWIASLAASGLSPHTVDGYRRALLAVINDEEECTGLKLPYLRLRRVKKPRQVVRCYTHDELRRLIAAAEPLDGMVPTDGRRRGDWWAALIECGYVTGLRRGDLFRFDAEAICSDGTASLVQHKTGIPITVQLPPSAVARLASLGGRYPLRRPYHASYIVVFWGTLRELAGVNRGSFKWVRRSAASYADAVQRGNGSRVLGHTSDKCFRASYEDVSITQPNPITPPPLS